MGAQGHIVAAAQLDDAWHPDEVDARLEIEAADDRRTGYNEDPQLRDGLGQRMGYCPAASDMAQTETVVAVDQDASRSRCNDEPLGTLSVAPIRTIISATGVSARQTLLARIPAPRRADRNLMSSHKSLYSYIWQHSRRDQIVILCIALLAQPFYFLTLTLPKLIINGPIQGGGFEDPGATQAFMQLSFALPGFLPAWLSGTWTIFSGFPLERLPYLFALSLTFLALVGFNGFLKFLVNTMKGRLGERLLRRLRFELVDRILRFPPAHLRRVKQAEMASMVKDEVEPLGGFTGDAIVWPVFLAGQAITAMTFILVQNIWLGLVSGAIVAVQAVVIPYLRRPILRLGKLRQIQARELAGRVGELVDGGADIRSQGTGNWERAEIIARLGRIFDIRFELYQRKYFVKSLNNFIAQLTPFIFYAAGGYFVITGQLDVGQLVAVIIAYKDLPGPIKELIDWDLQRQDVEIKYNQVMEQFHPEGMRPPQEVPPAAAVTKELDRIEFKNVKLADDAGFMLLDDVDTRLSPGQSVAVTGPSGGGKEAFGLAFSRQFALREGVIRAGDADFSDMNDAVAARKIAYAGAEAFFFPVDIRSNLLYGLRTQTRAVDPAGLPESRRLLKELQRAGNPPLDARQDWTDYTALGSADAAGILDRIIEVLSIVGLEADVYQFGLQSRLDPATNTAVADRIVEARIALHARLAQPGLEGLVERFDPNTFNRNASIAENILFGTSLDPDLQPARLPVLPHFRRVMAEEGLEKHLVAMGLSIAETMVEMFSTLPPDHPFFEEYGFIPAASLPQYQQIIRRARSGNLTYADRSALAALPMPYVDARHRLGILTPEITERLLAARRTFAETLPRDLQGRISFYHEETYNAAASILDNILLGRVSYGAAQAHERVSTLVRETLDRLDVRDLIIDAGLGFYCGAGGKRLSTVQRQKLSLARALIKDPAFLVVNGALANLDDSQKARIVDRVLAHRRSRATLWVLTKDDLAERFDRTLIFENGRLTSDTLATGAGILS
jgi:putative ABC transport system ATP-binding protein